MAKMKHQKIVNGLKYELFAEGINGKHLRHFSDGLAHGTKEEDIYPEFPTPKKTFTLRDTRSALDHKDTLSKPKSNKEDLHE